MKDFVVAGRLHYHFGRCYCCSTHYRLHVYYLPHTAIIHDAHRCPVLSCIVLTFSAIIIQTMIQLPVIRYGL